MKKLPLLFTTLFLLLVFKSGYGTTVNVDVGNFFFAPADFTVSVGDTIIWTMSEGLHTTTSTDIPLNDAPWDHPFTGIGDSFMYIPTVPGTYNYHCTIHPTLMMASFTVTATLPYEENFDYPAGDTLTNYGWDNHSGTGDFIMITTGSLTYPGYPSSGIGNSVTLHGGSGSREDVHVNFTDVSTGAVYASALVNVMTASTDGSYFLHLAEAFPTFNFRGRLFIKDDGAGNLLFGLSKGSTSTVEYTTATYTYNMTYLVVLKYEFVGDATGDDDIVKLYIDPNVTQPEPGVPDLTNSDVTSDVVVGSIAMRQGGETHDTQVDGIRVATTWNDIVPVELVSFNASVAGESVRLNWRTATEINNSGFDIERKSDAALWQKIGFVPGHGTTTEVQSYSFTDNNLTAGTYSYRLRQVDFSGSFEYSNIVEVEISVPQKYELVQNYPNPFNPATTIRFSIPEASTVTLKVYNMLGQEVTTLINRFLEAGVHSINFNAEGLNSGMYFYRLEAGSFSEVRKMTLLK